MRASRDGSGGAPSLQQRSYATYPRLWILAAGVILAAACGEPGQVPLASDPGAAAEVHAIPDAEFKPLLFVGAAARSLPAAKRGQVAKVVRADRGGRVKMKSAFEGDDTDRELELKVEVRIRRGALERDTEISIALEDPGRSSTLIFGEHGTQFRIPAEVTIEAEGLDLSGLDSGSIDLYWYDPASDAWHPVQMLTLETDDDEIKGTWLLDHFSRYSLSGGGGR